MKNLKISFILFLLLFSVKVSRAEGKDTTGVFMTLENETIYMYGDASINAEDVVYHDVKNKEHGYAMRKMKWMIFGNRVWCAFPIRKGNRTYRLQEIIAMNNKYILMSFWQGASFLYIYDYQSNLVEGKIAIYQTGVGAKRHNRKAYEQISPYFNSCKELIKKFETNLEYDRFLLRDITLEQCDGAPPIMDFINTFKDKRMETD